MQSLDDNPKPKEISIALEFSKYLPSLNISHKKNINEFANISINSSNYHFYSKTAIIFLLIDVHQQCDSFRYMYVAPPLQNKTYKTTVKQQSELLTLNRTRNYFPYLYNWEYLLSMTIKYLHSHLNKRKKVVFARKR